MMTRWRVSSGRFSANRLVCESTTLRQAACMTEVIAIRASARINSLGVAMLHHPASYPSVRCVHRGGM